MSGPIGRDRPGPCIIVLKRYDNLPVAVGQLNSLAVIVQLPRKRTKYAADTVRRLHCGRIFSYHKIIFWTNHCSRLERIFDAVRECESSQILDDSSIVIQFNKFKRLIPRGYPPIFEGMVHYLANHESHTGPINT